MALKHNVNDSTELKDLLTSVEQYVDNPMKGLPEEVFLFATKITPMINVDLIVRDKNGRILLSWRDDEHCGTGWHVPGGIIRYKENASERIEKVAELELGCKVIYSDNPVEVKELINDKEYRAHFISLVYECKIDGNLDLSKQEKNKNEVGYLEWHRTFPSNMIPVHHSYKSYFKED